MKSLALFLLLVGSLSPWQMPTGLKQHLESTAAEANVASSRVNSSLTPVAVPLKINSPALSLSATAAYAIDSTTAQPLFTKNADKQLPIASITKLVTALIIVRDHNLNETITIPTLPTYGIDDEVIGLRPGQKLIIGDLLSAILIHSGNDAADALAIADSGSKEAFAIKMNAVVDRWGITGAKFSNPSGLQDINNQASPRALAKISLLALQNPNLRQMIAQPRTAITATDGKSFNLTTTNALLPSGRFTGIKTGYTVAAGQCFIGLTKVKGHEVITVVLGSNDRFGETVKLADWITRSYQWL